MTQQRIVIIGAGPAGLMAAHELVQHGLQPIVLERGDDVGGLARTVTYKGYRFDIGGHRFYTKLPEVQQYWERMLGQDFVRLPRLSRIYYRGRFLAYPLDLFNVLTNLGLLESVRIVLSYLQARLRPFPRQETFEQWLTNHFGRQLYQTFFQTYTEKVWGIPCHQIQADLAAQRIKGLSVTAAISSALFNTYEVKSLIPEFHYPVLGPGLLWQRMREAIEAGGGQVWLGCEVVQLQHEDRRIAAVVVWDGGTKRSLPTDQVISTMPLAELVARLDPSAPQEVRHAAGGLRYRALIMVGLIINRAHLFPDHWIYIHEPQVKVGRIQNLKNWSVAMLPDPQKTGLGLEYFCNGGDDLWQMSDAELIELATRELSILGLGDPAEVEDGVVIRQSGAYPILDLAYPARVRLICQYLSLLENLQTIGRNGMHRYNNMDHSMLTGMLAARNLLGEKHDLWSVNTERAL